MRKIFFIAFDCIPNPNRFLCSISVFYYSQYCYFMITTVNGIFGSRNSSEVIYSNYIIMYIAYCCIIQLTLSINQTIDFLIVCPVSPSAVHISFTICGSDPIFSLKHKMCAFAKMPLN